MKKLTLFAILAIVVIPLVVIAAPQDTLRKAIVHIATMQDENGGWSRMKGEFPAEAESTAWAIIALTMNGIAPEKVDKGVAFLLKDQRPDGSWSNNTAGTAFTIMALKQANKGDEAIKKAIQYLRDVQDPEGGFKRLGKEGPPLTKKGPGLRPHGSRPAHGRGFTQRRGGGVGPEKALESLRSGEAEIGELRDDEERVVEAEARARAAQENRRAAVSRMLDRAQRIGMLQEEIARRRSATRKPADPVTGRWQTVIDPGGRRGGPPARPRRDLAFRRLRPRRRVPRLGPGDVYR